jgi:large subunit ribosomal protein L21
MYAVAEIAGKQYMLEEGKSVRVDLLGLTDGTDYDIEKVCLLKDAGGKVSVGTPYLTGAVVKAKVEVAEEKARKLYVFFYRPKKDSKRKIGHRQRYSVLKIEKIVAGS